MEAGVPWHPPSWLLWYDILFTTQKVNNLLCQPHICVFFGDVVPDPGVCVCLFGFDIYSTQDDCCVFPFCIFSSLFILFYYLSFFIFYPILYHFVFF